MERGAGSGPVAEVGHAAYAVKRKATKQQSRKSDFEQGGCSRRQGCDCKLRMRGPVGKCRDVPNGCSVLRRNGEQVLVVGAVAPHFRPAGVGRCGG
jgi:hypothetical protein